MAKAETKLVPAGRVSVKVTPVASWGPWLMTSAVNVRFVPTVDGRGPALGEIKLKSAPEAGEVFSQTLMSLAVPTAIRSASLSALRSCTIGATLLETSRTGRENEPSPFPRRNLNTRVLERPPDAFVRYARSSFPSPLKSPTSG